MQNWIVVKDNTEYIFLFIRKHDLVAFGTGDINVQIMELNPVT